MGKFYHRLRIQQQRAHINQQVDHLRYNTLGSSDALTAGARHNGNISEMRWDAGLPSGYRYTFYGINRLTAAGYAEGNLFPSNVNYLYYQLYIVIVYCYCIQ